MSWLHLGMWRGSVAFGFACVIGCSSSSEQFTDQRRAASQTFEEAQTAFKRGDLAGAEQKYTAAIDLHGLNPDAYGEALIKRAVCWSAAGKHAEALTDLQKLESGGGPPDLINAARSYVLKKQGKSAESRAAFAKARRFNPRIQELK